MPPKRARRTDRTTRKSDVIQEPSNNDTHMETYEETYEENVERPGSDVRDTDGPDVFPPAPGRMPPD
jgi:hypothetical protein